MVTSTHLSWSKPSILCADIIYTPEGFEWQDYRRMIYWEQRESKRPWTNLNNSA